MERKIGETFEYKGKTYKVVRSTQSSCSGCAFDLAITCPANEEACSCPCSGSEREDGTNVTFVEVKPEEKHDAVEEVLRLMPKEKTEIPSDLYKRLVYLGIIDPTGTRDSNVGNSDYSKHLIQPWSIMLDHNLNYWDGDIIKRTLREKAEGGMTKTEARIMDYKKIIHNCEERIRQLELGK